MRGERGLLRSREHTRRMIECTRVLNTAHQRIEREELAELRARLAHRNFIPHTLRHVLSCHQILVVPRLIVLAEDAVCVDQPMEPTRQARPVPSSTPRLTCSLSIRRVRCLPSDKHMMSATNATMSCERGAFRRFRSLFGTSSSFDCFACCDTYFAVTSTK